MKTERIVLGVLAVIALGSVSLVIPDAQNKHPALAPLKNSRITLQDTDSEFPVWVIEVQGDDKNWSVECFTYFNTHDSPEGALDYCDWQVRKGSSAGALRRRKQDTSTLITKYKDYIR